MSRIPVGTDPAALSIAARHVLLDALAALSDHHEAVIVVGAQAVYLRSDDADFTVGAYTADADLALDPAQLGPDPRIDAAMEAAGFTLERGPNDNPQPGKWLRTVPVDGISRTIPVDLIVPASLDGAPKSKRGARIPPHPGIAAMRAAGLEAVVVDHDPFTIASLSPLHDDRTITVNVAGVVALLIAKTQISDRLADAGRRRDRLTDKDAGDVVRLMRADTARHARTTLMRLLVTPTVREVARAGAHLLREQFGAPAAPGVEMAVRALAGGALDEGAVRNLCVAYTRTLLADVDT